MKNEIPISIRAYAKSINVNESAVRRAIREKKIKKGYDPVKKKIIPSIADKEYGDLQKVAKPKAGVSKIKVAEKMEKPAKPSKFKTQPVEDDDEDDGILDLSDNPSYDELIDSIPITPTLSYAEALRRKEIIGLALDKKKLEESERILIKKDEVEKTLFQFGVLLKKELLAMPPKIIHEIRNAQSEIEAQNVMTFELNSILNTFADFAEMKL